MNTGQFDPHAFFTLAQALGLPGQSEAHRRSSVSRAYYACFHVARVALERSSRWQAGTVNAHQTVINELHRRNRSHLAMRLTVLKRRRELADYDLASPLDEHTCDDGLEKAAELLRLLDRS